MSIPSAIRQQCWLRCNGEVYKAKCNILWCRNEITVYSFHCAHNRPRSDGGGIELSNLRTTCSQCNLSMGDKYTIDEYISTFSALTIRWFIINHPLKGC